MAGQQHQHSEPARVRVSYSIPLSVAPPSLSLTSRNARADDATGHRLGVNALCIDSAARPGTLYSGGRDGSVLAWQAQTNAYRFALNGHSDWVNDILMAANGSCLLSASSDHSVKLWQLPDAAQDDSLSQQHIQPLTLGYHNDYVKCLAYSPLTNMVASGGLDTKIALWDLNTLQSTWTTSTINILPHTCIQPNLLWASTKGHHDDPKCSIYALAANPAGSVLVSGSPDKLIRVWDPRTHRRVGQLVGHTDYVRAVLVSEDGKTVLSASSDATIKLWSLNTNRCLSMYTHHNDSVWALFSQHPALQVFYAGSKDGTVSKMDMRQPVVWPSHYSYYSPNSHPYQRSCHLINAHDQARLEDEKSGIISVAYNPVFLCQQPQPIGKLVAGSVDNDQAYVWTVSAGNSSISRWKDPTIQSHMAKGGVHGGASTPWLIQGSDHHLSQDRKTMPINVENRQRIPSVLPSINVSATSLNVTSNTPPCSRQNYSSLLRTGEPSVDEETWEEWHDFDYDMNVVNGDSAEANLYVHAPDMPAVLWHQPDAIILGQHGLMKHNILSNKRMVLSRDSDNNVDLWDIVKCCKVRTFGKCDFDEIFKKINVPEFGVDWCTVDTKIGAVTVHLQQNRCFDAEMYYDESNVPGVSFSQDQRVNIGKWVLVSLFQHLRNSVQAYRHVKSTDGDNCEIDPPLEYPRHELLLPTSANADTSFPYGQSLLPLSQGIPEIRNNTAATTDTDDTSNPQLSLPNLINLTVDLSDLPTTADIHEIHSAPPTAGQFSSAPLTNLGRDRSLSSGSMQKNSGRLLNHFRRFSMKRRSRTASDESLKRKVEGEESHLTTQVGHGETSLGAVVGGERSGIEVLGPVSGYTSLLASSPNTLPPIPLASNIRIRISAETTETSSAIDLYSGTITDAALDVNEIQQVAPPWLLDVALHERAPTKDTVKIGFQLLPFPGSDLPELPNGNNRLSSNRMIRLRKLLLYVSEKCPILPLPKAVGSEQSTIMAENYIEFVISNKPVSHLCTLGTVRTYVWKGTGELVMHYRRLVSSK